MEEKELWMNKLKEKLGDYSEPLPASGWEQLEKELMPPVERKIYPYRKWTVAAAAVILLALVSSLSLYFLGTPAADDIRHAKTPALASVPDILPDAQQPDATGTTVEPVVRPVVKDRRNGIFHNRQQMQMHLFRKKNRLLWKWELSRVTGKQKWNRWKKRRLLSRSRRIQNNREINHAVLPAEISCIFRLRRHPHRKVRGRWDFR